MATALASLLALGCGAGTDADPAPDETNAPSCAGPWEIALPDGSCEPVGLGPDDCSEGFAHDGVDACDPMLPTTPCPTGTMAIPGDVTCRPVMTCGTGPWGDLTVDSATLYVDQSYTGADADGTSTRPFPTLSLAVEAAPAGAFIAVAAGIYNESVFVQNKAVTVFGVCPERVVLRGTGVPGFCPLSTFCVGTGADNTVVGGMTIEGPGIGVALSGSQNVVVDRARITGNERGISLQRDLGPSSLEVRDSLLEDNTEFAVYVSASQVTVTRSHIRNTLPVNGRFGRGINGQPACQGDTCDNSTRASLIVDRSFIEQSHDAGLRLRGGDLTMTDSVVRRTQPIPDGQDFGFGLQLIGSCDETDGPPVCDPAARTIATVAGSVIEDNHDTGIVVVGSDLNLERTAVRRTQPRLADLSSGRGITAQQACRTGPDGGCAPDTRSSLRLAHVLVADNHTLGVDISGSTLTAEASVVRGTLPQASNGVGGRGVALQHRCADPTLLEVACVDEDRSRGELNGLLLADNHETALHVSGSDLVLNRSVVRDTHPRQSDLRAGRGLNAQPPCLAGQSDNACEVQTRSTAVVTHSRFSGHHEFGIIANISADVTMTDCVVSDTKAEAAEGLFGDAVTASGTATMTLLNVLIRDAARAGVSAFGGAVDLRGSTIVCAAVPLAGQDLLDNRFSLADGGDNLCGCPEALDTCRLGTASLTPPARPEN